MPHVISPALTARHVRPPATGCGAACTNALGVGPIPRSPLILAPQQYAAPDVVTPQACAPPAEIEVNESPPVTGTGTGLVVDSVSPCPSSPLWLSPQQTAPPDVSPHANATRALNEEKRRTPCTVT